MYAYKTAPKLVVASTMDVMLWDTAKDRVIRTCSLWPLLWKYGTNFAAKVVRESTDTLYYYGKAGAMDLNTCNAIDVPVTLAGIDGQYIVDDKYLVDFNGDLWRYDLSNMSARPYVI